MPRNRPGAPEDRIRIQHMMDAARQAIGFAEGKSRMPAPGALALLGVAGLVGARRRRA
jgi:MYXO-CTERM domain-containing protein